MLLENKRIAVTGADGFIGSHLVEALVKQCAKVRALTYYNSFGSNGWLDNLPRSKQQAIEIISGDVRDCYGMRKFLDGCDVVFHLAALVAIPYSYKCPQSYIDTNISGTLNVLQAAADLNLEKVIHTSTSEVYGSAQFVPITESHPLQGQSPYAASKIGADQLAHSFYTSFGLPICTVRPFNTYGPRQSARAVIPTVISQLAARVPRLKLGNTAPTRDFNYISDTVQGFIAAAKSDVAIGEVINIGSQYEISIANLAELIAKLMGKSVDIATESQRVRPKDSEVQRLFANSQKAQAILDWRPQYTGVGGLTTGLTTTIEWFLSGDNLKLYSSDRYNI